MKIAVVNLGCKVNRVESDSILMAQMALDNEPSSVQDADVVVINTCTVTGEADRKTRKTVRKVLRDNTHASVLVTGCAAAINPSFFEELDNRIKVVDKATLLDGSATLVRVGAVFPTRVAVKVQDGCNHACTYCIVHIARGKAWSRPLKEVVAEVQDLEAVGVREVVLTGIDMGSYYFEGNRLTELLAALLANTSTVRFRVSSIEPRSVAPSFIELLATSEGRICRHLHLPLQSGSSKLLAEMNRPYSAEDFLALAQSLKDAVPGLSLTTDIIVGFPGETEEEFEETVTLAREVGFSKIHVFRYSMREGTPAAERSDQIDPAIKEARAKKLLAVNDELRSAFAQSLIGCDEQVVVETTGKAMGERYYHVAVPPEMEPGSSVVVRLTDIDSSGIFTL